MDGRSVLLSDCVVGGLRRLAIEGFVALPRRGMEVGGLLLGDADDREVRLEDFDEVPCEHRYGPSYALSESDRQTLHEMLAAWPATKTPVVGFYRSFTSRDPVIEEADEGFVSEHFPEGWFVYLMLQPLSVDNCLVSVRFFRDGVLVPATEDSRCPVVVTKAPPERAPAGADRVIESVRKAAPASLPAASVQAPSLPSASLPAATLKPASLPLSILPPSILPPSILPPSILRSRVHAEEPEAAPRDHTRWWAAALVCVVSAAAGAWISRIAITPPTPSTEPHWADLHMDARPVDGQLEVKWDASQSAPAATRGRLEVTDGSSRREIDLDPEQLRGGRFTYAPANADVRLRLTLYAKDAGIAADTVRVKASPDQPVRHAGQSSAGQSSGAQSSGAQPTATAHAAPRVAVAPAEVHEVQPRVPEGIRSRMAAPVIIPVEVEVSDRGQVLQAVAAKDRLNDGVHRYLAELAQKAALKWRFRPAQTTTGDRVAASKTLRFVFTP